jgi:hypothetical protein
MEEICKKVNKNIKVIWMEDYYEGEKNIKGER